MSEEMQAPIAVDFPLRGEWRAPTTPGKQIPSHGTDIFGQRYAYDFIRTAPGSKTRTSKRLPLSYYLGGIPLKDYFAWNQPVLAPISGKVVIVRDGLAESQHLQFFGVMRVVTNNSKSVKESLKRKEQPDVQPIAGNHVVIESNGIFAFFAHLVNGSIIVKEGDVVEVGQQIGNLGHSGNSTEPHLHFHLMDRTDFWTAQGLPCCFNNVELFENGTWKKVTNYIPKATDLFRR